jgi:hypothetical protein
MRRQKPRNMEIPMAENVKGADAEKGKRGKQTAAGIGHNLADIRKKAEPAMKRLFKLQQEMDKDLAGYKADFNNAYEEEAEKIGIKKSLLTAEYKRALRNKRQQEKEMMMEPDEREVTESLRACFEGTPFAAIFAGEIAKSANAAK